MTLYIIVIVCRGYDAWASHKSQEVPTRLPWSRLAGQVTHVGVTLNVPVATGVE